jgi:hypothetical protein
MEATELLLSIEGVSVLRFPPNQPAELLAKGQLDLVVAQPARMYSLQVQGLRFDLGPEVQVMKGEQNAYVLVRAEDMLGISAEPPIAGEIAEILEMTFADSCQFIRETRDQCSLERVVIVEAEAEDELQRPKQGRIKQLFKSGKEKLSAGLVKGASLAFVTYLKAKVYLKRRFAKTRTVARPQEKTVSLSQAALILRDMSAPPAPAVPEDPALSDIMQNYGRMSQHLASLQIPHDTK